MPQVERPTFFEGQVLGADDLGLAVQYDRDGRARHSRCLHTWGIACGCELTAEDRQSSDAVPVPYQEITLSDGVVIDGTGLAVVVTESERLSEDIFDQLNVAVSSGDPDYPVFVTGRDADPRQAPLSVGACGSGQNTRVVEAWDITFGRPGDELTIDEQTVPPVAEGPGSASGDPWKVLIGFVRWNTDIQKFTRFSYDAGGATRRYAGVRAADVVAPAGRLFLRSRPAGSQGKPIVLVDDKDGGEFSFGLDDGNGGITRVFTINADGSSIMGSGLVQSGVATDGMILPLPKGVTQAQVDSGAVLLHVRVTPRFTGNEEPPFGTNWLSSVRECFVDGDRRVRCLIRWHDLSLSTFPPTQDLPGACDYLLIALAPAKEDQS